MSDHDETISTLADTVQRWKASHDALAAKNEHLRAALKAITSTAVGDPTFASVHRIARAALDGTP